MSQTPESYWEASAPPLARMPPLDAEIETEVLVVGGGFTGMNAGLELAERGTDVVVIDA